MRSVSIPGCCGGLQLSDFGHTPNAGYQTNHTEEEIEKFLKQNIDANKGYKGFLVAYLNQHQVDKIGKIFTKCGFKKSKPKMHPGHGNNIYMLTRNLNDE